MYFFNQCESYIKYPMQKGEFYIWGDVQVWSY